ncbi:MAG: tRNA preQ1(34) S-adenosylmethionine ribosyltransferase-isomerase QueA [Caldilineales bacterium]|nr:tRNA preQ1(34) S-adenosylmethionine ribosyltransferase-isomerase QueA [Caldilineales bacterium]
MSTISLAPALSTADFDYNLPPEMIAQTPVEPRDHARLLVLDRATGQIEHRHIYDLPDYLGASDLLVLNDTRVIPARLLGTKETGGQVEVFLLRALENGEWQALVGGKNLTEGKRIRFETSDAESVWATILSAGEGPLRRIMFAPPIDDLLDELGQTPLPPYIHTPLADPERYQTIYSRREGSVAAPTAGLHFTPELLLTLRDKGVRFAYVTLHVGQDTFRPVSILDPTQHDIHSEWLEFSTETARLVNETRLGGGRIVAVGTTSVRALETAAKIALGLNPADPAPPELMCGWKTTAAFTGDTDLFILPGHQFRAVDVMLTNFHLPRSTLLMLVSAFAGRDRITQAYDEAIESGYRFYSFGDAMLIL